MRRAVVIAVLLGGSFTLPAMLQAQTRAAATASAAAPKAAAKAVAPAKAGAAIRVSRNSWGQPDLGGFWANATITKEVRDRSLGARAIYTPEEVAREEGIVQTEIKVGNQVIDPNKGRPSVGGDPLPAGIRPELAVASGPSGGYERGWLDTGSTVMRVHGEARTSILTTPDGQYPARKGQAAGGRGGAAGGGAGRGGGGGGAGRGGGRGGGAAYIDTPQGRVSTVPLVGGLDNPEQRTISDRCILSFGRNGGPPMLANGYYNNNYNIVQGKDSVAIMTEMVHDVRIVRLNGKHRTDGVRPYFGDSIGHYEGDTLVVETTNIPQLQAYAGSWENLTVTEKFTRVNATHLLYQFTIHDPTLWDADWGGEYEFYSLPPGMRVEEYACHEGNYALDSILAGARAEDAAAAKTAVR